MLLAGDLPHSTGFSRGRFPAGEVAGRHQHDELFEIFYAEQGQGLIRMDSSVIVLEPAVCVSVETVEYHEVENAGKEELVVNYPEVIR